MITDLRRALDAVGERAGFAPGTVRTKMFRHTFCSAALQLLDRGAPISKELEFRVEQHREVGDVKERLEALLPGNQNSNGKAVTSDCDADAS